MANTARLREETAPHNVISIDRASSSHSETSAPIPLRVAATQDLVLEHKPFYELTKRCMDIAGAVLIALILLVALPILAIIIRIDSPGPIFYKQARVGKNGKIFTIWKLRSMRSDAEKTGRNGRL